jgi:flagellar biosynthesis activator protein FlaF
MYGATAAAYKSVQTNTNSGRELEAAVLTKAAYQLKRCQERWDDPDCEQMLEEALRINQKIWSVFQSELVRPEHPLPKQLRQDILSLSAFIDKRVVELLASPTPEMLTAIININLSLAAGLRGDGM